MEKVQLCFVATSGRARNRGKEEAQRSVPSYYLIVIEYETADAAMC